MSSRRKAAALAIVAIPLVLVLLGALAQPMLASSLAEASLDVTSSDTASAPVGFFAQPLANATNGSIGECMVERYNATKPADVTDLNCTSNDVRLATYELVTGPSSCIPGEQITVTIRGQFVATSNERWDVGLFVATDGGDPNTLGGECYNDSLHPVSDDNTDLNLVGGSGPFYNGEITEDPSDACGDIQQNTPNYFVTAEIPIICQDSDNDNIADVNSCTVWDNSTSDGSVNKPSCLSELDTTAQTSAKCTCQPMDIVGLEVPESGTIEVVKEVIPADNSGLFNLLIDGQAHASNVGDLGTTGPVTVAAGTNLNPGEDHTVSETAGTGTLLADYDTSIECVDRDTSTFDGGIPLTWTGPGPLTVPVDPDDDIVCTITNEVLEGTLTLVKTVTNDDGGTAVVSDFQAYIDTTPVDWDTGYTYDADTPLVASEDAEPGYQAGLWGGDCAPDGTVTIEAGVDKICSINNNDIAPTLTLNKLVVNDDGGTLTTADFPAFIDGAAATWGTAYDVQANVQHTASETQQSGYTASAWGGDCAADGTVTLLLGQNKTCTITNDDIAPTLTLTKTVVNDDGGDLDLADFPAFIDGGAATWGTAYGVQANVQHTASETQQPGYTASAWGGDCAADGTIRLLPGDNKTCSITNDDIAPTLTLTKTVVNDDGGDLDLGDFPAFIDGGAATWGTAYDVQANVQHTASETPQSGYSASAWGGDCAADGTVTVLPGENKTCTITNNDVAATLTLVKTVINDNGGGLLVGDFPLFIDGTSATSGVAYPVQANVQHTASETQQSGYTASAWGGDCASDGTVTVLPGENKTCTITNNDVAPTLTLVKTVINNDGGGLQVGDFPLFIDGTSATSSVAYPVQANVQHTASETQQSGYSASAWGGDCAANGTITLLPGENKTCTVTNNDQPAYLTVIKHVVNDDGWSYVAGDFTMTINGITVPAGASFAGAESPGVTRQVYPGSYNVTESGPVPYSASYSAGCTGSIALGESKSCTVTNDDLKISIDIEKWTNGQDADAPIGPYVHKGDPINWTYKVTNTGDVTLSNVAVTDSKGATVSCPKTTLLAGELMTCTATGTAIEGQYVNQGTAEGYYESIKASDVDLSHYFGIDPCINLVKLGPKSASIGSKITYVFRVTNCSAKTPLDNVKLSDPRFPAMGVVNLGHLDPGQSKEHIYVYTVKESDGTEIINVAKAVGEDPLGKVVDDTDDWIVPLKPKQPPEEQFVPEWGSLALLASALAPLAGYTRMRRRKR